MQAYILQRLVLAVPTLIGVSLLTFVGLRLIMPYDAVDLILHEYATEDPELANQMRRDLGLESNVLVEYVRFMGDVVRGDLGNSLYSGRPVLQEMKDRVPVSVELGLIALASTVLLAIPIGVISAVNQDRWPDYLARVTAIVLHSLPGFWLAILAITLGSIYFGWAPSINYRGFTEDPVAHLKIMLPPAILIGLTPSASVVRLVRTQVLEVLREDYVRTARAKGVQERTVLFRHALRNALLPVVTVVGVGLPASIISGTVLFEQIFVIPGMGRYLVQAVRNLDYPVIQSTNMIFAFLLVFSVIIVDLLYVVIDPRIRYE